MIKDLVRVNKTCMGKSTQTSGNEYSVVLKYNEKSITMLFHDNYRNESEKDDFLYALLMDAMLYEECPNLADFMRELGYDYEQRKEA